MRDSSLRAAAETDLSRSAAVAEVEGADGVGASSGQSKKRLFTHSYAARPSPSNAFSTVNAQRRSGAFARRTVPKPARVRSACRNSSTSISVANTFCTQPM
jgi:hypothetical protein